MKSLIVLITLVLAAAIPATGAWSRDRNPDNKLVEFAGGGDWEVWCIRLASSGKVLCDLSHVLTYQPRPSFRAMILRAFSEQDGKIRFELETETQTRLSRIVAAGAIVPLSGCGSPCVVAGRDSEKLAELLSAGGEARMQFRDYLVETWDVAVPLQGFASGLTELHRLQQKYGY